MILKEYINKLKMKKERMKNILEGWNMKLLKNKEN